MTIANAVPVTISHQGARGGMESASSQAVTTALRSVRKSLTDLPRILSIAASQTTAVTVASDRLTTMAGPKYQAYAAIPGSSAMSTFNMICVTLGAAVM